MTIDEYASDIHSWIKTIRKRTAASCVWVLGHSEGGLVALKAAQDTTDICGRSWSRPRDAQLLKQADPSAKLEFIADANHVLKTVRSDKRNENLATYTNPDLPLADSIVETIATFVHACSKDHPAPDTGR